jgi:glycosyltransferase involved in cell wall biosynthesis
MKKHKLLILGTRGIPGSHGGFETFAERLALYLAKKGWRVTVYCQSYGDKLSYSIWQGINLVHIPVPKDNSLCSILFDFKAASHAVKQEGLILTLGYNTAVFSLLYRLRNRVNLTNMDGMEWWRKKWNALEKSWLYLNERCAVWFSNYLIADHPQIKRYLRTEVKTAKPIAVIPYSAEVVTKADKTLLKKYNLVPQQYALVIARPEPENSILEIVSAFSQKRRNIPLVVLGKYWPQEVSYHQKVLASASDEVIFVGGIYDHEVVKALRYYTSLYVHGHQVGGTNPSLIEAMSSGSPVLAHNNPFNSWVAGEGAVYFQDVADCDEKLTQLLDDPSKLQAMKQSSLARYRAEFADDQDLKAHEELFLSIIEPKNSISTETRQSLKAKSIV